MVRRKQVLRRRKRQRRPLVRVTAQNYLKLNNVSFSAARVSRRHCCGTLVAQHVLGGQSLSLQFIGSRSLYLLAQQVIEVKRSIVWSTCRVSLQVTSFARVRCDRVN